ncbi:hypothetical protein, partial [Pseudomonas aeruginosa]|uniref:hypothetical protein n=1 Tax=Pseudomonas aeruginosa TaxID=287 RepID=UPI002B2384BE
KSPNLALFALFSLLLIGSTIDARTDPDAYWKSVTNAEAIPEVIQSLINKGYLVSPFSIKKGSNAEEKHLTRAHESENLRFFPYTGHEDKPVHESENLRFFPYADHNDKPAHESENL